MSLLKFQRRSDAQNAARFAPQVPASVKALMEGYSIEVMPRTAAKIESFADILPQGTRTYIAHIEGTEVDDMVATAARLRREGFEPVPHFPARLFKSHDELSETLRRYKGEADVSQALVLAGGPSTPVGDFDSSIQLLETGLFGDFRQLFVAGHPEGNRDIDPDGGTRNVTEALHWKQGFSETTDAEVAITTQFAFEAAPVIAWAERLADEGITLPVHLGIAGPAKLQTLIRFAIACGVGPSLDVLQKRARDVTKLVRPYEPTELVTEIADYCAANPDSLLKSLHIFPLGGIKTSAEWAISHSDATPKTPSLAAVSAEGQTTQTPPSNKDTT
ncbi:MULTISPECIES: methylenetetrahydrofolate reductase [Halocynthiibacter]|uniref:Methylenetetrahydrofolate reductase n=1 Tax=Halocynthiibacter halioticoli TaxID=2986804 RepID=A0AAE3LUI2_9RHOB|nr:MULTISPECIES: methylenetetrahydrofolate reductase [Halocynthiibacter]MCV6824265.1 methylenetetrahydrofolate reductase [Halocynthiibacter halioticoli]MCW4057266.1 methylenetetrahydrofolate reductase [Halocynthiibacter sp. SDUM655004]